MNLTFHARKHSFFLNFRFSQFRGCTFGSQPILIIDRDFSGAALTYRRTRTRILIESKCFITLDSQRRIYPLMCNDDQKHKYPLIGVWVWGLKVSDDSVEEDINTRRLLWAVLTEFMTNPGISSRYPLRQDQGSFLLINYGLNQTPKYFQFRSLQNVEYQMVSYENVLNGIDLNNNAGITASETLILDFSTLRKKGKVESVADLFGKHQPVIQNSGNGLQFTGNGLGTQSRDNPETNRQTFETQNGMGVARKPPNPSGSPFSAYMPAERSLGGSFPATTQGKASVEERIEKMEGMLHMLYDAFVQLN